ncbi:MAG: transporter related protein [Solirubrobacterales bacterium]|jgi:ABC-type sugar transport system ATPase subunit|nr:transporter related protein [Solirubrobacterales bacterium]
MTPLLTLRGVHKRFGGVHALDGAELTISEPGVVHVLIGQNGSGKSTMLGVLSGQLRVDAGELRLDGQPVRFTSPVAALRHGIAMVSQETAVAPDLTVAENVLLGRGLVRRWSGLSPAATRKRAQEVLARLELDYDPRQLVRDLRPDQRQMVEIARALSTDARILILDEPTSSLTDDEVEGLFGAIRQLKTQGVATVFVSHRLPELFAIGDEVTVLRDGRTVAQAPLAHFDPHSLVEAMVGEIAAREPRQPRGSRPSSRSGRDDAPPALRVRGLEVVGAVRGVDVEVGRGEIVGISGLVGAGRSELLEAIFGVRPLAAGTVELDGAAFAPSAPRDSIQRGLGFLPPDRKTEGLVLGMSVRGNVTMVQTLERARLRSPSSGAETRSAQAACDAMGVKTASLDAPVGSLSGGNQQKVALAKWLARGPRVLLLDEPTRGVDVAAKAEIHEQLRAVAADGVGLLVSSSENEELIELCDRILVMFRGRVVAALETENCSEPELVRLAGGHT